MAVLRLFAIILIFGAVSVAWLVLGATIEYRTSELSHSLSQEIDAHWGPSGLVQRAPVQYVEKVTVSKDKGEQREWTLPIPPLATDIQTHFVHDDRYMGLIWFSTYTVDFSAAYTIGRRTSQTKFEKFVFCLPDDAPLFENLTVTLDGQPQTLATIKEREQLVLSVPRDDKKHVVTVAYRTQARDRWKYNLAESNNAPTLIKEFSLVATTNFRNVDYPSGCASPTPHPAQDIAGGKRAEWKFENRSTRQEIGIEMPARANAGPMAARMAFFAPVSLFFFFTVLFTITVLKKIPLHPMHYLFIAAGFFAFHILMAYLVDKIDIQYTFWICAATSVLLVTSYMRVVAGARFGLVDMGLAQLVYLIGFSYAFFWTGWTGLTIVIVAIITLFVLMQATARVDWTQVFARQPAKPPQP